jgi:NACHT domain- and WD repeat-containing protein
MSLFYLYIFLFFFLIFKVEPLGVSLGLDIIFQMLSNINRTISETQLPIVREALNQCNSPLYVKLVLDEVSLWKSYTVDINLANSIDDCVSKLFERIENSHGKVLVSHALAYITASKNGLSEAELEDLISLDETVCYNCYDIYFLDLFVVVFCFFFLLIEFVCVDFN